jgi:hypothetical protein
MAGKGRNAPKTAATTNFLSLPHPAPHPASGANAIHLTRPAKAVSTNKINGFVLSAAPGSRAEKVQNEP